MAAVLSVRTLTQELWTTYGHSLVCGDVEDLSFDDIEFGREMYWVALMQVFDGTRRRGIDDRVVVDVLRCGIPATYLSTLFTACSPGSLVEVRDRLLTDDTRCEVRLRSLVRAGHALKTAQWVWPWSAEEFVAFTRLICIENGSVHSLFSLLASYRDILCQTGFLELIVLFSDWELGDRLSSAPDRENHYALLCAFCEPLRTVLETELHGDATALCTFFGTGMSFVAAAPASWTLRDVEWIALLAREDYLYAWHHPATIDLFFCQAEQRRAVSSSGRVDLGAYSLEKLSRLEGHLSSQGKDLLRVLLRTTELSHEDLYTIAKELC